MIIVNDRPCDGVDLSHWNNDPLLMEQSWLKFFGHKATHPGGSGMPQGFDQKLPSRRLRAADAGIRWRAFYMWVVPKSVARAAVQVELLSRYVGELHEGESVYLDWEDKTVPFTMIEEISYYMDLVFPARWFMYVNDQSPDMTAWLESNKETDAVPVMHPNYSLDLGLIEARKWNAMIWQTGAGIPPAFNGEVPLDLVLRPDLLDWVCGRQPSQ